MRLALSAPDYRAALSVNRARSPSRVGITLQCFNIFAKLSEVDAVMRHRPGLQRRVREVHPELAFLRMHGAPRMLARKKSAGGRAQRLRLLEREGFTGIAAALASRPRGVGADDVLDAYAVCWSALRIATGSAARIPARPERDAHGLFMEIWY